jgi:Tol biopolymer transport system component
MTSFDRFEYRLPALLDELAVPRLPDYANDLFARTAATRQRPGWTFPERWLPMSALTRRFAAAPNIPWRVGVVVALLIVAALIGLLVAGSRVTRVPAPFGPAGNGVIPYISNGNLFIGDLRTGTSRLLVDGSGDMGQPQFSPDGTRVAYIQLASGTAQQLINIFVVRSDGSNVKQITPQPIVDADWKQISWTPDSRRIAVVRPVDGVNQLDLFDASGNGTVQRLSAAAGLDSLQFRPPDGAEILFRASAKSASGIQGFGLYRMNADGSNVRLLGEPAVVDDTLDLTSATYSADGSRIFYNRWTSDASVGDPGCCQLYVMNADGKNQHEFVPNPGTAWDGDAKVSPDGTLIAFWHNPNDRPNHGLFVIRADGTGPLIETGPALAGLTLWVWAPDSSKILMYPKDASNANAYLLDPDGGPWTTVPWLSDNDIDWQRVAS